MVSEYYVCHGRASVVDVYSNISLLFARRRRHSDIDGDALGIQKGASASLVCFHDSSALQQGMQF